MCCSLFAFVSVSFIRVFSVASRSFVLWWPARASSRKRVERRRRRVEGGRIGRREWHCLTKLRGIKFAFYCARFLNASFRGKLPSAIMEVVISRFLSGIWTWYRCLIRRLVSMVNRSAEQRFLHVFDSSNIHRTLIHRQNFKKSFPKNVSDLPIYTLVINIRKQRKFFPRYWECYQIIRKLNFKRYKILI